MTSPQSEPASGLPAPAPEQPAVPDVSSAHGVQRLLIKNTALLMMGQTLAIPLSILINAMLGRYLGPEDFGTIYLAGSFVSLGFLVADWGQNGTVPAAVAQNHALSGEVLGTGLALRLCLSLFVYLALIALTTVLGYDAEFQVVLGLVVATVTIGGVTGTVLDTVRGFERADIVAVGTVGQQFMAVLIVVPTVMLGGHLHAALGAQIGTAACVLCLVLLATRRLGITRLSYARERLRWLLKEGAPFLALGLVISLQPMIDATLLSKFAPPTTVGWFAASRKLVGVLVSPAGALIGALYPTLCRLYAEDQKAFLDTARGALKSSVILVVPVAIGAAFYPDLGIRLFSRDAFGPAEDNLRVLSLFVLLVYFTMTLGTALAAGGKQRPWAITQFMCVFVSAGVDPVLVPWFERTAGNGGLGVCVAIVLSEVLMLVVGIWIAPKGLFDRALWRSIGLGGLAGAAMAGSAWLLSGLSPFLGAPIAVAVYFGCLWATGGLTREHVGPLLDIVARKTRRFRSA